MLPHTWAAGSGLKVKLFVTQTLPASSIAMLPGPSIDTPSPTNLRASVQAAGGESAGRAGW